MRYTEHEYKLDHIFDYIRLFASFILGAFRLFAEIGNKIVYLRVKGETNTLTLLLKKSIMLNGIALVVSIGYGLFTRHYGVSTSNLFVSGTVPVISFGLSLVILGIAFVASTRLKQPALHKFQNTGTKKKDREVDDIDDAGLDIVDDREDEAIEDKEVVVDKEAEPIKIKREVGTLTDDEVKKQPAMDTDSFAKLFNNPKNKPVDISFDVPNKSAPEVAVTDETGKTFEAVPSNTPTNSPNTVLSRNATKSEIREKAASLSQEGSLDILSRKFGSRSEELSRRVELGRQKPTYFKPRLDVIEQDDDDDDLGEDYDD